MSMSDPIADMLTRIRNAVAAKQEKVTMPASAVKAELAAILKQEGYIRNFKIVKDGKQGEIRISLKYDGDTPAIRGIRRISKPGMRIYSGVDKIPVILNGLGSAILSTNRGILTDREAREARVGGEIVCYVW